MLHEGQERSSRKLVRVEGQNFRGWGCSECAWVFNPSGPPTGDSLDEMKRNFQPDFRGRNTTDVEYLVRRMENQPASQATKGLADQ